MEAAASGTGLLVPRSTIQQPRELEGAKILDVEQIHAQAAIAFITADCRVRTPVDDLVLAEGEPPLKKSR